MSVSVSGWLWPLLFQKGNKGERAPALVHVTLGCLDQCPSADPLPCEWWRERGGREAAYLHSRHLMLWASDCECPALWPCEWQRRLRRLAEGRHKRSTVDTLCSNNLGSPALLPCEWQKWKQIESMLKFSRHLVQRRCGQLCPAARLTWARLVVVP